MKWSFVVWKPMQGDEFTLTGAFNQLSAGAFHVWEVRESTRGWAGVSRVIYHRSWDVPESSASVCAGISQWQCYPGFLLRKTQSAEMQGKTKQCVKLLTQNFISWPWPFHCSALALPFPQSSQKRAEEVLLLCQPCVLSPLPFHTPPFPAIISPLTLRNLLLPPRRHHVWAYRVSVPSLGQRGLEQTALCPPQSVAPGLDPSAAPRARGAAARAEGPPAARQLPAIHAEEQQGARPRGEEKEGRRGWKVPSGHAWAAGRGALVEPMAERGNSGEAAGRGAAGGGWAWWGASRRVCLIVWFCSPQ